MNERAAITDERFQRIKSVFIAALEAGESGFASVLDRECDGDLGLRREVEALLRVRRSERLRTNAAWGMAGVDGVTGSLLGYTTGDRVGAYRLLERIGEGTFGEVWLAEQENPVRPKVAIKILKAGMDTREVLARFEAERRALAMMDHPNVARVSDAGATPQGRPYFVMEYVPGVPITGYCDAARLPIRARLELFVDICRAVEHAHQKGIIHRDLKPQNIIVTVHDGKPAPKVIDFGVAKALFGDEADAAFATESGHGVGTLEYMPPEQTGRISSDIDIRADVYSLGVVLYELLTGTLPLDFSGIRRAGLDSLAAIICESDPPTPSTRLSSLGTRHGSSELTAFAKARGSDPRSLQRQLRGDLDWIVMKAMEKSRTRRYGAVSALVDDVRRHLAAEPVQAAPPSYFYRMRKFVSRHRTGVISGALLSAIIIASMVVIGLSRERASRAERAREQLTAHVEGQRLLVRDMLEAAKPSIALGGDTTVLKAVLDTAAERIRQGDLKVAPTAELDLRFTIGEAYREIGQFIAAHEILDTTPTLAVSIGGPESLLAADAAVIHATLLYDEGQYEAALTESREALGIRQHIRVDDSADLAKNMEAVAQALDGLGRFGEALPLHRTALEMRRRLCPAGDRQVAQSLSYLAECLRGLGRAREALHYQQEALALYRQFPSNERLNIALTLNNVAVCLSDLSRSEEAIGPQREALEEFKRLYGRDHPYIVNGLTNLGGCLQDQGEPAEALTAYESALEMAQRIYPGDHLSTAMCLNNVAFCLDAMSRWPEALAKYEVALAMQRRLFPAGHPQNAMGLNNIARTLTSLGRREDAVERYQEAVAEAAKTLAANDARLARIESNFGVCLIELDRLGDAEHRLLRAQRVLESHPDAPPTHRRENLARLVLLYETWARSDVNKRGPAKEWKDRLEEFDSGVASQPAP